MLQVTSVPSAMRLVVWCCCVCELPFVAANLNVADSADRAETPSDDRSTFNVHAMLWEIGLVICAVWAVVILGSMHHKPTQKRKLDKLDCESSAAGPSANKRNSRKPRLEDQMVDRMKLNESVFSSCRIGDIDAAESALRRHEKLGRPSWDAYKVVITLCAKMDDPDRAHHWLERAETLGAYKTGDVVCYNALINMYCKRKDIEKAIGLASTMLEAGLQLDTITYNTLIDGCARVGDKAGAERWMAMMLEEGVKPSVVSFASVMRACAGAEDNERAETWLREADKLGIELNMICFSAVINAFAKVGNIDASYVWVDHMISHGVTGSVHCFFTMLDQIIKRKDLSQIDKLKEKMIAAGCNFDAGMYNSVVIAAAKQGHVERVQQWTQEAAAAGFRLPRAVRAAAKTLPGWTPPAGLKDEQEQHAWPDRFRMAQSDTNIELDWERARALEGKRFVGTIKEYISTKFGYIVSEDVRAVFGRDVFLSNSDNPEGFAKGQRVWFTLQIDRRRGLPRAFELVQFSTAASD